MKLIKRKTQKILNDVAKKSGVSLANVKAEIQAAIEDARNNPDPEKQAEFEKLFGDRTPTPEEFIKAISREIKK